MSGGGNSISRLWATPRRASQSSGALKAGEFTGTAL